MKHITLYRTVALAVSSMVIPQVVAAQRTPVIPVPAAPSMAQRGLSVGDSAPNFSLSGATKDGMVSKPIRLSDYRGQVVVLAFYPKARSSGCTKQLERYRDEYATMFRNGNRVKVIAISADPDTALLSWAKDAGFPMMLASDVAGFAGRAYGVLDEGSRRHYRFLYVIDPKGRIVHADKPFSVQDPTAYETLAQVVTKWADTK